MPRIPAPALLALALALGVPLAAQDGAAAPAAGAAEGAAAPTATAPAAPATEVPAGTDQAVTAATLVGKWRFVDIKGEGMPPEVKERMTQSAPVLTFLADGSMLMEKDGETKKGLWRLDGDQLYGREDGPDEKEEPVGVKLVGDRLEFHPPGRDQVMVLARVQ